MRASLEERFWSKVEKTETCWIWTAAKVSGYGRFALRHNHQVTAHRVSFEMVNGPIPDGMQLDHVCHNRACVRPDHLRVTTCKQNNENRRGAQANNQSCGIRGVTWHKQFKKWQASVMHHGKPHWCGRYSTLEEAEAAVIAKRLELFTHNDMDRRAIREHL